MSVTAQPSIVLPEGLGATVTTGQADYGSWAELTAATGGDFSLEAVIGHLSTNASTIIFQIGVGAAGAETVIATVQGRCYGQQSQPNIYPFQNPIHIGTGVRIAIRIRTPGTGSATAYVAVQGRLGLAADQIVATGTVFYPDTPNANTTVAANGTAWAPGAWTEMIGGLAAACGLNTLTIRCRAAVEFEIDIGIGAAGAEQVIGTIKSWSASAYYSEWAWIIPGPVLIPASTRVAIRLRKAGTSTTAWEYASLTVYGAYDPAPIVPEEYEPNPDRDVEGTEIGIPWVELRDAVDTLHVRSSVDLADPGNYYGGFKAGEVVSLGPIRRALSNYRGESEGTTFRWRVSDGNRFWRGLLADDLIVINLSAVVRMISDEARRALQLARTIVRGLVRRWKLPSPLQFEFEAEDTLSRLLTTKIPRRTITLTDFPNCPPDVVGRPVRIVFGEASDMPVLPPPALLAPTGLTATVHGDGGSVTRRYAVTAMSGDYGHPFYQAPADHRGETDAAYVTVAGCPADEDLSPTNYVELRWNEVEGAAAYRVYGRTPGLVKLLDCADIDGTGPVYYDGRRPSGRAEFDRLKMNSDPPATNNTAAQDTGHGIVPVQYVGDRVLPDGQTWREGVFACHAVSHVLAVYQSGVRLADTLESEDGPFLLPGWDGWTAVIGAAKYRDYNGRRYSSIFWLPSSIENDQGAMDGSAALSLNVIGFESVGDGTGTPITKLPLVYLHFLQNFGFGDYQSGAWLDSPAFPADPAPEDADYIRMIDEASFAAADAIGDARVTGGYVGAGVIVEGDSQVLLRDVVTRFNQSCDVDDGRDRKTRFFVSMEDDDPTQLDGALQYTQERDIREDTFEVIDDDNELFTVRPYAYGFNPTTSTWAVEGEMRDEASIAAMAGEERIAQRLDLYFVWAQAVAEDIVARALERSKRPPRLVRWVTGLGGLSSELGDIVLVTHTDGPDHGGWVDRPIRIREHQISPGTCEVELVGRDQRHIPWSS